MGWACCSNVAALAGRVLYGQAVAILLIISYALLYEADEKVTGRNTFPISPFSCQEINIHPWNQMHETI